MTIVVEDGTGKSDANSFTSVADATTYHASRGNSAWAALASDTIREQALIRAADYMEQAYRNRWAGYRVTSTQSLSWPRSWVPMDDVDYISTYYDNDTVPTLVANACAELALKAATATLLSDQGQNVTSETVGPLSVTYDKYSGQATRYTAVDSSLASLFANGGSSIQMKVVRR